MVIPGINKYRKHKKIESTNRVLYPVLLNVGETLTKKALEFETIGDLTRKNSSQHSLCPAIIL